MADDITLTLDKHGLAAVLLHADGGRIYREASEQWRKCSASAGEHPGEKATFTLTIEVTFDGEDRDRIVAASKHRPACAKPRAAMLYRAGDGTRELFASDSPDQIGLNLASIPERH
jgi:hypothetical protein